MATKCPVTDIITSSLINGLTQAVPGTDKNDMKIDKTKKYKNLKEKNENEMT